MHLILVHIGDDFPEYINTCVKQIRNISNIQIHVLISKSHSNKLHECSNLTIQSLEDISTTIFIELFERMSRLDSKFRGGFWKYAVMRFFYMHSYILNNKLTDVFHIEYDNLIYFDFTTKVDIFRKKDSWLILDAEHRCIPSFMYFKNVNSIEHMLPIFIKASENGVNDMMALASYYHMNKEKVGLLPIIVNYKEAIPNKYYEHAAEFNCLFDGACVGQYIGGVDPRNIPGDTTGFINETSIIKCDKCSIEWQGKKPMLNGLPLVNLHIHSKDLKRWSSSE